MANDLHPRDSFRYVGEVVFLVVLSAIGTLIGVSTDSKDYFARWAVANAADVNRLLRPVGVSIEGNILFAALVWLLGALIIGLAMLLRLRSVTRTKLEARLGTTETKLAVAETKLANADTRISSLLASEEALGARVATLSAEVEALNDERTQSLVQIERLKAPSREALSIEEQYSKSIAATRDIIEGHGYDEPEFKFTRITETTTVDADGTAHVERDYDVEAGVNEAHSWRFQIFADASAEPIKFLSGLDFRARQVAERPGEALRYLVNLDEKLKKEITLFFIPPLKPGESRRFRLSYKWPKFAGDLIGTGATTFFVNYRTAARTDTASVAYEIRFAKMLGELRCDVVSAPDGGVLSPDHNEMNWVWRYENAEMAMDKARLELLVRRHDGPKAN